MIRVTLEDLDNRDGLAKRQREHLANPNKPLTTTRSLQAKENPSLDPFDTNIITTGQVLMGAGTQVTAEEFAQAYQNAAAQGVIRLWSEGSIDEYPSQEELKNSLKGSFAIPPPDAGSAAAVIAIARGEVGYIEGPGNRNKYASIAGHSDGLAWCATFIDAVFTMAGMEDKVMIDASTENCRTRAIKQGRWGNQPRVGAVVFFNYQGAGRNVSHVEIVTEVQGSNLITIGGNTSSGSSGSQDNGDGVFQRTRPISSAVGYYYPDYPSEQQMLDSARLR